MSKLLFKDFFEKWRTGTDFKDIALTRVSSDAQPDKALAFVYFGHVNLDFDGSPTAYGPLRLNPDDSLNNAGNPTQGWFGVASLPSTSAFVTGHLVEIDQTAPGFHPKGDKKKPVEFPAVQQARFGDPSRGSLFRRRPEIRRRCWGRSRLFVKTPLSTPRRWPLALSICSCRGIIAFNSVISDLRCVTTKTDRAAFPSST